MTAPKLAVLGVCALLAGCVGYKSVDAVKPVTVGDGITVSPQIQWATAKNQAVTNAVWTIDGFGLDELRFYTGIAAGNPLFSIPGVSRRDMAAYREAMLPDDVMEFISTTLGKGGAQQVRTENLRPAPFGTVTGFRFDLSFINADGLEMKGEALFAQRRKKLDAILFIAPAEYYFGRYSATVEKIFGSVRVPETPAKTAQAS